MLSLVARMRMPHAVAIGIFIAAYSAVAAQAPYFPVYFETLGMPLATIGLLGSTAALCGLAAAPAWGILADRLTAAGGSGARSALIAASVLAALSALALAFMADPVVVALLVVCYSLSFAGIGPVLDAHALDLVGADQPRYARLRVWGSIAFVVGSLVVGALIEASGIRAIFVVLVGALVTSAVLASRLRAPGARQAHSSSNVPRLDGLRAVLRNTPIMSFICAALIAWSASMAVNSFLSIYLVSIGASATLVGGSWALGAVVEIPLMLAFPALAARFGIDRLIVVGGAMLLARTAVLLLTDDPIVATASMALHGAGFALLLVGGITYVAQRALPRAGATAQGVLAGVVVGLAQAIGPGLSGLIAGAAGIEAAFTVALGLSAVGLIALVVAVRLGARPATAS